MTRLLIWDDSIRRRSAAIAWWALLAAGVPGCIVNPVPTPSKSSTTMDNTGGSGGFSADGTQSSAADTGTTVPAGGGTDSKSSADAGNAGNNDDDGSVFADTSADDASGDGGSPELPDDVTQGSDATTTSD